MSGKIKRNFLSALALVMLVFVLPFSVQADGGEDAFTQTINGYQVALIFAEKPTIGENKIQVQVQDAMAMPVRDARVEVSLALVGEDSHVVAQEPSSHNNMPGMAEHASEAPEHDDIPDASESANVHGTATHGEIQTIQLEPSHHEEGEYAGGIHIESSGDWIVTVHLTVEDETMEVGFPLMLNSGARNGILASFLSVNILILIVAGLLRKPNFALKSL